MTIQNIESHVGKGSDENLQEFREKRERKRMIRRIVLIGVTAALVLVMAFLLLRFGFLARKITVKGTTDYTAEEIIKYCGISIGDNLFAISEDDVQSVLKKEFPYIKTVRVERAYPSEVILHITEEYTTYYYEVEGEYFLFNHSLRLMDKFDSFEALVQVREAIRVEMPLPKQAIVPQYISFFEDAAYVSDTIRALSDSKLAAYVTSIDLRDKFLLRMVCGKSVNVELGDSENLKGKFSLLARLLFENGNNLTGNVDLTQYPQCFYSLVEEYE